MSWEGVPFSGRYHEFKTYKVYNSYRHHEAERVDRYFATHPQMTMFGLKITPTNLAQNYIK